MTKSPPAQFGNAKNVLKIQCAFLKLAISLLLHHYSYFLSNKKKSKVNSAISLSLVFPLPSSVSCRLNPVSLLTSFISCLSSFVSRLSSPTSHLYSLDSCLLPPFSQKDFHGNYRQFWTFSFRLEFETHPNRRLFD